MMRPSQIVFWVLSLAVSLICSCATPGQVTVNTPQGNRDSYPPLFEDSATRRQEVQDAWKNLLAESGLPETKLELEPVLNTPRSLPTTLAGQIPISKKSGTLDEMEMREALRGFIERTRGLLSGDPKNNPLSLKDLSLASFANDGNFYRVVYQQMSYSFPIANGYGELRLIVDKKARLLQWNSRLIPPVDLPVTPAVKSSEFVDRMINRDFTYTNIAGQPQSYRVSKREEVVIKDLVVYPRVTDNRVSIHLAYPVEVGKGMTWTVYIDAINGQELEVKQNFAS